MELSNFIVKRSKKLENLTQVETTAIYQQIVVGAYCTFATDVHSSYYTKF